ncbi:class I SAM-dependent DNA methyltransferase [Shewanella phaeophyticola]|uniref:Class I SAM-dependent methyltransferase n=1 Tax=Shewanella phaeophyticola TaxID=2978345 RepID=A0ABT2P844_9GAMM|nr:class I SAM-dependent methyltransferase [Shewanella sp. KJ10-1]MCT8987920.1 class I SAM-dependent methyltransferase [Shewanella sp. KJ10-1]
MSTNALYTDLSGYYDLMCCDINYQQQSNSVARLHQILGNQGKQHLDLACGTGTHVRHFIDLGFDSSGLDINQPMLDIAMRRCPEAQFSLQNMTEFYVEEKLDLITCFLYSIHYSQGTEALKACIASVHKALNSGGLFCFNSVDKHKINNKALVRHSADFEDSRFIFESGWHYSGAGDMQTLNLSIAKTQFDATQLWQDSHTMVATSFTELQTLLSPYFDVQIFEHDYDRIIPWDLASGNALFVCTKREV